jgi:hypothetical protein
LIQGLEAALKALFELRNIMMEFGILKILGDSKPSDDSGKR